MCLNNDEFHEVLNHLLENENLSKKIKLDLTEGWQETPARVRNGQIIMNECFLSLLWCSSYHILSIYKNLLLPYLNGNSIAPEEINTAIKLSEDVFDYGLSLKPGYDEWPIRIPYPREFETNDSVCLTTALWSIAANFVISHEIAHIYHKHQECIGEQSYRQEYEADNTAFNWLNKEGVEAADFTFQMGIFIALFTTIMMDLSPEKDKEKHPSSFSRMQNILNKFEIDDKHQIWLLALFSVKIRFSRFDKDLDFCFDGEMTFKEQFNELLDKLIVRD